MSEHILGSLTMEDFGKLRRMRSEDAEIFLSTHTLNEDEYAQALQLVGKSIHTPSPSMQYNPSRRLWIASIWLLGASWRTIASSQSITQQTAMQIASRILPSAGPERMAIRLQSTISLEDISAYQSKYLANLDMLIDLPPTEVAQWLLDNTELDK